MNYYNEIDKYAAQWLRNLIEARHIPNGDVDDRSISDVKPSELVGYTQCHFFAGIGGWSLALRLAGWSDDRPVWTGSCPCQPFSVAGQGAGTADERHLWPHWFHLIRALRPDTIFGEQVEAAINHGWLDLVQDDLEGEGYAFAPVGIPAAGVGAPHIRQRLWFVADAVSAGRTQRWTESGGGSVAGDGVVGNPELYGLIADSLRREVDPSEVGSGVLEHPGSGSQWDAYDWLPCRDGKWRPVEPGTFPLAYGVSNRVGRLRAYGNAIVPQVAAQVIQAYMECRPC